MLHHFFDGSAYYAVVANGSQAHIHKFSLSQANEQGSLTLFTGEKTDVCLDSWFTNPLVTYNSGTDKSTVNLPYANQSTLKLGVVNTEDGSVTYPTIANNATSFELDDDWRGTDVVLGYTYEMNVGLPKFYMTEKVPVLYLLTSLLT